MLAIAKSGLNDPLLGGKTLAMIFEKPSLRTRVSFAVAMAHLGGEGLILRDEEVVEEATSLEDAQKFVEHHLKDSECYEFYWAMRQVAYDERKTTKKKAKA